MITQNMIQQFHDNGYVIVPSVFSPDEVENYKTHFMQMNEHYVSTDTRVRTDEPLAQYPRIMQPHRRDERSLQWLTDDRIDQCMQALLGASPYAVQTMFYFKPAGSRGQALHQDQHFLQVQPGTCMAAWMAIDPCDEENGCLQVVPRTRDLPTLCTTTANLNESFTDITVDLPEGYDPEPVIMQPGDILFFNGQVVHGSFPNTSTDRFRRALIGHYVIAEAETVGEYYHPVYRMDGTIVDFGVSDKSSPCGVWVDKDGEPIIEFLG